MSVRDENISKDVVEVLLEKALHESGMDEYSKGLLAGLKAAYYINSMENQDFIEWENMPYDEKVKYVEEYLSKAEGDVEELWQSRYDILSEMAR